jgi:hypothetical protein
MSNQRLNALSKLDLGHIGSEGPSQEEVKRVIVVGERG